MCIIDTKGVFHLEEPGQNLVIRSQQKKKLKFLYKKNHHFYLNVFL